MKNIIEAMNWRYAVNKFDLNKKLTEEQLNTLLDSARLSPSSFGLQPWKFIVVKDEDIRKKLKEVGYNQDKIVDASDLIVLAVPKVIDEKLADDYIKYVSEVRSIPVENLKGYSDMIKGSISYRTPAERVEWAARQAYIALGVLITSAAIMGIDTGPMEGFDAKKFDEILGLDKIGFESKVCIALGFRSESDEAAKYKKVRFTKDQVVLEK